MATAPDDTKHAFRPIQPPLYFFTEKPSSVSEDKNLQPAGKCHESCCRTFSIAQEYQHGKIGRAAEQRILFDGKTPLQLRAVRELQGRLYTPGPEDICCCVFPCGTSRPNAQTLRLLVLAEGSGSIFGYPQRRIHEDVYRISLEPFLISFGATLQGLPPDIRGHDQFLPMNPHVVSKTVCGAGPQRQNACRSLEEPFLPQNGVDGTLVEQN